MPGVPAPFPTEIWLRIFGYLIRSGLLPNEEASFSEQLRIFSQADAARRLSILNNVLSLKISLVCRHFYQIVSHDSENLVLEDDQGSFWKRSNHTLLQTKWLCLGPRFPKSHKELLWPSLEVLRTDAVQNSVEIDPLLNQAPRLKALSFMIHLNVHNHPFSHPIFHQLTHLALALVIHRPLEPVEFPSIQFLQIDFESSISLADNEETLPWRLPSLRSLVLQGRLREPSYQGLFPFFQRHSSTLACLLSTLGVSREGRRVHPALLRHFPHLEIYGVNTYALILGQLATPVSEHVDTDVDTDVDPRPITVLTTGMSLAEVHSLPRIFAEQLRLCVATQGTRYVDRLMLSDSWSELREAIGGVKDTAAAISRNMERFRYLNSIDIRVFDRLGEELGKEMLANDHFLDLDGAYHLEEPAEDIIAWGSDDELKESMVSRDLSTETLGYDGNMTQAKPARKSNTFKRLKELLGGM